MFALDSRIMVIIRNLERVMADSKYQNGFSSHSLVIISMPMIVLIATRAFFLLNKNNSPDRSEVLPSTHGSSSITGVTIFTYLGVDYLLREC